MAYKTLYNIPVFWNDEYQQLNYINEPFNDPDQEKIWLAQGFCGKFTGDMCDMRSPQPSWNQQIINTFAMLGWKDIGTSYYRMDPGTILPTHSDLYKKYIELFSLQDQTQNIYRAVVFLENWASGHYFEIDNEPVVRWTAGTVVAWSYDVPHMAANLGTAPRYTLQITGHL